MQAAAWPRGGERQRPGTRLCRSPVLRQCGHPGPPRWRAQRYAGTRRWQGGAPGDGYRCTIAIDGAAVLRVRARHWRGKPAPRPGFLSPAAEKADSSMLTGAAGLWRRRTGVGCSKCWRGSGAGRASRLGGLGCSRRTGHLGKHANKGVSEVTDKVGWGTWWWGGRLGKDGRRALVGVSAAGSVLHLCGGGRPAKGALRAAPRWHGCRGRRSVMTAARL